MERTLSPLLIHIVYLKDNFDEKRIAQLMMFIWYLRTIAGPAAMNELDNILEQKPSNVGDEKWKICLDEFEIKKAKLNDKINGHHFLPDDNSENLLLRLLKQTNSGHKKTPSKSNKPEYTT